MNKTENSISISPKKNLLLFGFVFGLLSFSNLTPMNAQVDPFTQVTDDILVQGNMAMEGDKIVFTSKSAYTQEYLIVLYDIPTKDTTVISRLSHANTYHLDISGDRIVWQQSENDEWDIYNYLISRPDLGAYPLITNLGDQTSPAIYENTLVYIDHYGDDFRSNLYMYDISTATTTQITTDNELQQYEPDVYGDYIVWYDGRNGNEDVFMYRISTGEEIQVTNDEEDQRNPCIYEKTVVWEDYRNYNADIYFHVIGYFPDTDPVRFNQPVFTHESSSQLNMMAQINPKIHGDHIVFQDNRSYHWDIYIADFFNPVHARSKPLVEEPRFQENPVIWGDRVAWLDERDYSGSGIYFNDVYMWERPPGIDLMAYIEDDPDPVAVDAELEYKVLVKNFGGSTAINPFFEFTFPISTEFISMSGFNDAGYSRVGNVLSCYLDSVPANGSDTVIIRVQPVLETEIEASVEITASEEDIDPNNNTAFCKTKVVWKVPSIVDEGGMATVAVDASGRPHFCYLTSTWGGMLLYKNSVSRNYPATVLDSSTYCWAPAIAVDMNHKIHIAYSRAESGSAESKGLFYINNSAGVWSEPEQIADNVGDGESVCIQIDKNGKVHVSCMTSLWAEGETQYYIRSDAWSKVHTIQGTYNAAFFDLDTSDYAHFAYYDLSTYGLCYETNSPDGTWSQAIGPDDDWHGGQMEGISADIAVDKESRPHISYIGATADWGNEDYKYAVKNGSSWSDRILEDGDFSSGYNCIDTDPFDNPHICFQNVASGKLRYTWKEDGTWHKKTIDYLEDIIPGIRIVDLSIDRYGFTHIVYVLDDLIHYVTNKLPVPEPEISVTPQSINFPDRLVGDTTEFKRVTIGNTGAADLVISDVRIVWRDSSSFSIVRTSCAIIAPGDTCSVDVVFNPTIIGNKTALLWIDSNDPLNPTKGVSLNGLGVDGILWDVGSQAFGEVNLGDSAINQYTLKNVGNTALVVQGLYLEAGDTEDFFYRNFPEVSFSIPAEDSVSFDLVFKPTMEGSRSVSMKIYSTGGNFTRTLSGSGVIPSYKLKGEIRLPDNTIVDQGWIWAVNMDDDSPYYRYYYKALEGASSFDLGLLPELNLTMHFDPDETSYPGYIRTYLGDVPFIEDADVFTLDHDVEDILITLIEAPPDGNGSSDASGNLLEGDGKKSGLSIYNAGDDINGTPLDSVPVYLVDHSKNILHADVTNTDGQFSFSSISIGEYLLKIDYKGYEMSATNDTLLVTEAAQKFEIVALVANEEISTTITTITGLESRKKSFEWKVYPNPCSDWLWIEIEEGKPGMAIIDLFDLSGRMLLQQTAFISSSSETIEINSSQFESGYYMLRIRYMGKEQKLGIFHY